jgi:hypothetical protein
MTIQFPRKAISVFSAGLPAPSSSLVRRLVRARNDPGKERIRTWLVELDDAELRSSLGLTPEDIASLRESSLRSSLTRAAA